MQSEAVDELDKLVHAVDERQPLFIGISGKKETGKNSVATMLNMILTDVNDNQSAVMIVAFADQLKAIARDLFYWSGKKDNGGRWLLQRLGTEVVMGRHGLDFWVRRLNTRIKDELSHLVTMPRIVAITDVRFPFEFDYVKEKGGECWRVVRKLDELYDNGGTMSGGHRGHLQPAAVNDLLKAEATWLACAIDGEGSISMTGHKDGKTQPKVEICNTNMDFLTTAQNIVGTGKIYPNTAHDEKHPERKASYKYMLGGILNNHRLLIQLLPHLVIKRDKASEVIKKCEKRMALCRPKDNHLSEIALDGETRWDAVLDAGSLDELLEQVEKQVTRLQDKGLI